MSVLHWTRQRQMFPEMVVIIHREGEAAGWTLRVALVKPAAMFKEQALTLQVLL